MSAYLQTMEQFLAGQQEIMHAYLSGATPAESPAQGQARPAPHVAPPTAQAVVEPPLDPLPPLTPEPAQAHPAQEPAPAASQETGAQAPDEASPPEGEMSIQDTVLHLVSERTGYPIEMLGLDLDLEAELGIDSIKRVEILGAF
jgi:hypothetical protein